MTSTAPTSSLLGDLGQTVGAIQGGNWLSGGLSGGGPIEALGQVVSPLIQIAEAGFAFIMPLVQFLEEPLHLLTGDPGAITSSASNLGDAGQSVSSLADNYQQAAAAQTTSWTGDAADGYGGTSTDQATGNAALGQASSGLSDAANGGAGATAETLVEVLILIGAATAEIIGLCIEASTTSAESQGASWGAAIPEIVGVAASHGVEIADKMQDLLSSAQNLSGLVQQIQSAVQAAEQLITQFTGGSSGDATGEIGRAHV